MSRSLPVIDWEQNYESDKKRVQHQMRKEYILQKFYKITQMLECNWWELYREEATLKNHLRANFPYQRPLSEARLMQEIKSRRLFGYVQCDLKVPDYLKAYFANFAQTLKLPLWVEMISEIWWKNMQKKKGLCHNQKECSYEAST